MPSSPTHSPSQTPQSTHLAELSHETLREQLAAVLQRFEPLCVAPPQVRNEKALWFYPHEFQSVNQVWKEQGIDGVLTKWGEARTFATGLPLSLAKKPADLSPAAPANALVMLVFEFGNPLKPDPHQLNYFRSCHFELPEELASGIVRALSESTLLSRVVPRFDPLTSITLEGTPIQEVKCSSEWYGPDNIYGDGSNFIISLGISPSGEDSLETQLRFERDGSLHRKLWSANFSETGYEGHEQAWFALSTEELRAIIPIIARVAEIHPLHQRESRLGTWHGNTLHGDTLPAPWASLEF